MQQSDELLYGWSSVMVEVGAGAKRRDGTCGVGQNINVNDGRTSADRY